MRDVPISINLDDIAISDGNAMLYRQPFKSFVEARR